MSSPASSASPSERLSVALAGRYRIERELGQGGMATVYLAEDVKHDRKVAIKVLKPELAAVLGAERFVVEIKTTASLSHPHILPLFDSGTADGFLFYVMPYIQGETIREKLNRETQFGVDEAVRIAREVADALDYAHRHGVIHRDIKPENLLLHDGRAMVMDFGIALAVSAAAGGRMTETGLSLGTPHYMSPEQATADKEISARSDIYSLGSVLYEMLAGSPPHTGSSAQQIIMKIIAEPVEAVTRYRKTVPAHVAAAVAKSLEKLPADRFVTAKAFGDALGNPSFTTATATDRMVRAGGTPGISPVIFWATAGIAVLSLAAAGWSLTRAGPVAAVTRMSVVLPDSQHLAEGTSYRVAVSPDGRTIAYVGQGASATGTRLWVRRLDQLRATPLAGTDGAINPSFSPDGKRIAFVSAAPRAVRVIPIGGGPSTAVADSLVDLGGVSWGSDGYIYYDAHFTGDGLARVRASGGKPEVASMPDSGAGERYHTNPSTLPDGRGVLFTIARAGTIAAYDVGVLDTKTGKHRVLVHGVFARYAASGHLVFVTAEGLLMAAPFDLTRLQITGDPVPVAEGVAVRVLARGDVVISRDGLLVYAAGSGTGILQELVWVGRDGKASEVDPQFKRPFRSGVRISPDGRQAAVAQAEGPIRSVWVKQLDRGPAAKVTEDGGSPTWSPDGKVLLFAGPIDLRTVPADGSRLPTLLSVGGTSSPTLPEFTPDGKWMLYTVNGDVYKMASEMASGMATNGDSTRRPLIATRAFERMAVVSPDGRWIAYASDESGGTQVIVRPFPDVTISKRQVSVSGGIAPRWSRSGRELFFVDETLSMVSVPITPGATFVAGEPKRLFDASIYDVPNRPFDVAVDGRFLMIRPVGAVAPKPDELILVENFFADLKAKVKPR